MSAQTKKQIIIAVILAVVAIAAVLIFLFTGRGDTIDKYVFAFEGEEHTGKVYTCLLYTSRCVSETGPIISNIKLPESACVLNTYQNKRQSNRERNTPREVRRVKAATQFTL